jgi:acetyl esterase/lipase
MNIIYITIEYRLAPEHKFPAAVLDCFDVFRSLDVYGNGFGLEGQLGVDMSKACVVSGASGAAIAAALVLGLRYGQRSRPEDPQTTFKGMLLWSPMLRYQQDDISASQFDDDGVWSSRVAQQYWSLYLEGDSTSYDPRKASKLKYWQASPGTWKDLSDLPRTFIDVGYCEASRSEAVRFAQHMWCDGNSCELHV